jgi:hypothetical protein
VSKTRGLAVFLSAIVEVIPEVAAEVVGQNVIEDTGVMCGVLWTGQKL